MATGNWTQEDVDRINAARKNPQREREPDVQTIKPARGHKYRAEPCIVTADLTLFSKTDIEKAEAANGSYIVNVKVVPLLDRAKAALGITGEWFGSLKEGRRWIELRRLEQAGFVNDLRRQEPYELRVNDVRLGLWKCDFYYRERATISAEWSTFVTEDAKGKALPFDKWKRAHVEAQCGIKIRIT